MSPGPWTAECSLSRRARPRGPAALTFAIAFAFAAAVPAQTWELVDAAGIGAVCFDPVRGRVVRLGHHNVTLEWDGDQWFRHDVAGLPDLEPGLAMRTMVFDPVAARIVAVAGDGSPWHYDGTEWVHVGNQSWPPGVQALAFDVGRSRLVALATGAQTWEYIGTAWQQIATAHAPPLPPSSNTDPFVYDPRTGRTLFLTTSNGTTTDTWAYDGVDWAVLPTAGPPYRSLAAVGFDAARGRIVLAGGVVVRLGPPTQQADTWEWDGATWMPANANSGISPGSFWLCFDSWRHRLLAIGRGGGVQQWTGTTWVALLADVSPFAGRLAGDPIGGGLLSVAPGATWVRRHGGWWLAAGATNIDGIYRDVGGVVVGVSTTGQPGIRLWNGDSWLPLVTPLVLPTPRINYGLAFDSLRRRAVLFGGLGQQPPAFLGDTWEFDGASWRPLFPAVSPSPRVGPQMVFDPMRGRTMLVGGGGATNPTAAAETWTWNGILWSQPSTQANPFARSQAEQLGSALAFDAAAGRPIVLRFLGADIDTFEHDGLLWQLRTHATAALGFFAGNQVQAAVDPATGMLTMCSGFGLYQASLHPSVAEPRGSGCGSTLRLLAKAPPRAGAAEFGFDLRGAPGPALLALSASSANVPLGGGCVQQIQSLDLQFGTFLGAAGFAEVALPLPAVPALRGLLAFAQAASLDSASPIGVALSRQLALAIGD